MQEIWKPVEEFDGNYMISNFGRLKSIERIVKHPKGKCLHKEKILKEVQNKSGYIEYQITYNGKHYSRKAHRLVALAFIPNPYNKKQVNHIDGNKMNNNVNNLEWCTNKENITHAYHNNLCNKCKKIIQYDIKGDFIKEWITSGDIERELGLSRRHIHEACNGKRKTFHGYIWKYSDR